MPLTGRMQIGATGIVGTGKPIYGFDPVTGERLPQEFGTATPDDVNRACLLAQAAFRPYRSVSLETRADFIETIAKNIEALGDELIVRAGQETGLPRGRLEGERGRTVGQLRLFADVVRKGGFLDVRIDPKIADRKPLPRPDIRERHIGLGPVAVFGASNFPLAFSVAGGDTASALAAGCPVIVKAHSAHPGTSELVGQAIQIAVEQMQLPEGVFSLLFDSGYEIGSALVSAPQIKAVGFTGSRQGGLALVNIARQRAEPIPVYAEMSSINPVILLPGALQARAVEIAKAFVSSLTLGAGQFCTNPGLILAVDTVELKLFTQAAGVALSTIAAQPMLTEGINKAFCKGVARLEEHAAVTKVASGAPSGPCDALPALFETTAETFINDPVLSEEVFGASALMVVCRNVTELENVLELLDGQLTAAIHMADEDARTVKSLLPILEEKAGRILINGFGTGVEVCHAMVHGGPFPATSDGRSTSVGTLAIRRFLRPVAYQDFPEALRPDELRDDNPVKAPRSINGGLPTI